MIKICFICHGNICRSPMAEFVLKDMVQKKGVASEFEIISRATSTEEIGNDIHPGTRKVLKSMESPLSLGWLFSSLPGITGSTIT